jgi:hypothetical protein
LLLPFVLPHSCGTYDVGLTGSEGDTGKPRFGCNASLRKELLHCGATSAGCVNGMERAFDFVTGALLPGNQDVWQPLRDK